MKKSISTGTLSANLFLLIMTTTGCLPHDNYADINGVTIYYEIHGSGDPVLLLHGGFNDTAAWEHQIPTLAEEHRVIVMDSRGHGRSTDGQGPITYPILASDAVGLLDYLNIGRAHIVGWSDGGVAGLHIGKTFPERLNKLVVIGASAQGPGSLIPLIESLFFFKPTFRLIMDIMYRESYKRVGPTPDHWPVFRDKIYDLWAEKCYFSPGEGEDCMAPLENIAANVLIMAGELEMIQKEHTQALHSHLPNSMLRFIPWGTHMVMMEQPRVVNQAILDFL